MKWVTQADIGLSRAAAVWLIRRFIDPGGDIAFAAAADLGSIRSDDGAVPFETRLDGSYTFEDLVSEHFGDDPALAYISEIVHGAASATETDSVPESFGLWAIGQGLPALGGGSEAFERAMVIFDALHAHLSHRLTALERVRFSTAYDLVSGLPNRALFSEKLVYAVAYANRQGTMLAVIRIWFDLSGIEKSIVGVLREIGDRLTHSVREIDAVARIANEEFAVIISGPRNRSDAMIAVDKIREILSEPFDVEGGTCMIQSRIGISFYPPHGHDPATLLRTAGEALASAAERESELAVFGEEP